MKKLFTIIALTMSMMTFAQSARFEAISSAPDKENTIDSIYYSCRVYVLIKDNRGIIPNFYKDTLVVSSNAQSGFAVDIQRRNAVTGLLIRVNE